MPRQRSVKVMKFGGGCLRIPRHFRQVADIVAAQAPSQVVVVSAVFGMTDILAAAVQDALKTKHGVRETIRSIRRIHLHIIKLGLSDDSRRREAIKQLADLSAKLERLLTEVSFTKETTPFLRAHVLSFGERLSTRIVAAALQEKGVRAVPMDSEQIGMFTDDDGTNATAILPRVSQSFSRYILPLVEKGIVPVITGFYGCTPDFRFTLFGRNGTDYSAAVIAHAAHAQILEIWKEVAGFMSADPEIVTSARKIGALSYQEAAELASFGARILHPRTVEPVILGRIPINIKDLNRPGLPGTRITACGRLTNNGPKSITHSRDVAILKIRIPAGGERRGLASELEHILSRTGVHIFSIITTATGIHFLISGKDAVPCYHAIRKSGPRLGRHVALERDIALIGIVGHSLRKGSGISARILSTLDRENIELEMFVSGASPNAAYFAVKETDAVQAVTALHQEFFLRESTPDILGAPPAE